MNVVRGQDIRSKEEEALVQEVVNLRLESAPLDLDIRRNDVPDIKTKEDEMKWQKIIDERTRKARGLKEVVKDALNVQPLIETVETKEEPVVIKKKMGRPPKTKETECSVCKMKEHLTDCPMRPVEIK